MTLTVVRNAVIVIIVIHGVAEAVLVRVHVTCSITVSLMSSVMVSNTRSTQRFIITEKASNMAFQVWIFSVITNLRVSVGVALYYIQLTPEGGDGGGEKAEAQQQH